MSGSILVITPYCIGTSVNWSTLTQTWHPQSRIEPYCFLSKLKYTFYLPNGTLFISVLCCSVQFISVASFAENATKNNIYYNCSRECGTGGCWGPGPTMCVNCKNFVFEGYCLGSFSYFLSLLNRSSSFALQIFD